MSKTIRLTPEDVKHFVDVASKCDFDIDICLSLIHIQMCIRDRSNIMTDEGSNGRKETGIDMQKKERMANREVLRWVAMMMVVVLHYLGTVSYTHLDVYKRQEVVYGNEIHPGTAKGNRTA